MANANTEHSKRLRAESSVKARRKRLADPNYKQMSIGGDTAVINKFILMLDGTGAKTRIEQLQCLMEMLEKSKGV